MFHNFFAYHLTITFSWLETLAKFAEVVTAGSVLVAILEYHRRGKQDKNLATIDQISFFREKIIPKWNEIIKLIGNKDKKFWFSRIRLDSLDINEVKKGQDLKFNNQSSIFFDSSKNEPADWVDSSVLDELIFLLNMLEEFALKVTHLETQDHPALTSVHFAFVELVERNAAALLYVRNVVVGNPIYSATLSIYNSWKDMDKKPNYVKNLEKNGFITKSQKEELYRKKREASKDAD